MNQFQLNRYGMLLNTQEFLDSKSAIWSAIPRAVNCKNDLDEIILRIGEKSEEAQAGTSVRERKETIKAHIALKVSALAGILQAYGEETENPDLVHKASVTKSDVIRYADADLGAQVKAITSLAQDSLAALAEYGVSEAMITEILSSVEEFNGLIGKPRSILNNKYTAISTADQLVDEGNNLLKNRMDKLMLMYRETNQEFYEGYQRTRTIVDR